MPRMELAAAVAVAEDVRQRWCASCATSDGFEADVFAMVPSGLQKLAVWRGCTRCDPNGVLVCHYCGAVARGGARFHGHIAAVHGEG